MFDKLKQSGAQAKKLWDLQKQARQLKAELSNLAITAENTDSSIKITMNGEQKVTEILISDVALKSSNLTVDLKEIFNKAIDKTQKVAAEKMKGIAGSMGLPF